MITREKAIEVLEKANGLDDQFYAYTPTPIYYESINMAIEALKAQETPIEKVASDYGLTVDGVRFALEQYQTVICEITRSRMSKLSYYAKDIIQLANEMMCEGCELQEAQTPRVMTKEELKFLHPNDVVWLEDYDKPEVIPGIVWRRSAVDTDFVICGGGARGKDEDHEVRWRCWTARPTDKQREVEPWRSR